MYQYIPQYLEFSADCLIFSAWTGSRQYSNAVLPSSFRIVRLAPSCARKQAVAMELLIGSSPLMPRPAKGCTISVNHEKQAEDENHYTIYCSRTEKSDNSNSKCNNNTKLHQEEEEEEQQQQQPNNNVNNNNNNNNNNKNNNN